MKNLQTKIMRFILSALLLSSFSTCAEVEPAVDIGLELSGVPETVELGSVVKISLFAESTAELDFEYEWRPSEYNWSIETRANLIKQKNAALFTWDPTGNDVLSEEPIQITFIAKDSKGRRSEKTVSFRVIFGEGGPEFISSVSELYDPRSKRPIEFKVKIKHPSCSIADCVDIRLDDTTAPVGSTFERDSPLGGTFTWEPLPDQLKTRVHTINFIAEDGDSPAVIHEVTVVIRNGTQITNPDDDNLCPAEDLLSHLPLGPKRGLGEGYDVSVDVMSSSFDDVVVYWALGSDLDAQREVFSVKLNPSNGKYTGQIPSVSDRIDPNIGAVNVDYQICGVKEDSQDDDAFTCIPSFGLYSFVAALPDAPGCVDDEQEPNDSLGQSTEIGTEKWDYFIACAGNDDYVLTTSLNEEESTLIFAYNKDAQIDFAATDEAGNKVEMRQSPCTGATFLETTTPAGGGFYKVKVTGNNVPFRVRKQIISGGPGNCLDAAFEPNEEASNATKVNSGDTLSAEICNGEEIDVYKISANAGQTLKINANFSHDKGDLDMTLFSGTDTDDFIYGLGLVSTLSITDNETIEYRVETSGDFYVKIENVDYTRNNYEINFEVDEAPPCDTDRYQGNHSKSTGTFLQTPAGGVLNEENLQICPDQSDWYKRTEFVGVPLNGRLLSTDSTSITWRMYDFEGNLLATASAEDDALIINFTPPKTMAVFHEISTTKETEYSFTLTR